jgi:hypothetical protein
MALSPIALATADGCQSGYTPWGGGGFCDGPTQPNGSYYHCATTYVFGFRGTQCGWVCPPPPDNPIPPPAPPPEGRLMNDGFVVVSEDWGGRRNVRCVLAGDEDQARRAHQAHTLTAVSSRPRVTPHDLRHTAASLARMVGYLT